MQFWLIQTATTMELDSDYEPSQHGSDVDFIDNSEENNDLDEQMHKACEGAAEPVPLQSSSHSDKIGAACQYLKWWLHFFNQVGWEKAQSRHNEHWWLQFVHLLLDKFNDTDLAQIKEWFEEIMETHKLPEAVEEAAKEWRANHAKHSRFENVPRKRSHLMRQCRKMNNLAMMIPIEIRNAVEITFTDLFGATERQLKNAKEVEAFIKLAKRKKMPVDPGVDAKAYYTEAWQNFRYMFWKRENELCTSEMSVDERNKMRADLVDATGLAAVKVDTTECPHMERIFRSRPPQQGDSLEELTPVIVDYKGMRFMGYVCGTEETEAYSKMTVRIPGLKPEQTDTGTLLLVDAEDASVDAHWCLHVVRGTGNTSASTAMESENEDTIYTWNFESVIAFVQNIDPAKKEKIQLANGPWGYEAIMEQVQEVCGSLPTDDSEDKDDEEAKLDELDGFVERHFGSEPQLKRQKVSERVAEVMGNFYDCNRSKENQMVFDGMVAETVQKNTESTDATQRAVNRNKWRKMFKRRKYRIQ